MTDSVGPAPGLSFAPDGVLLRKAIARLERGPCAAVELAAEVFRLRGGSPMMAAHLVSELLNGVPDVEMASEGESAGSRTGVWRLKRPDPDAASETREDVAAAGPSGDAPAGARREADAGVERWDRGVAAGRSKPGAGVARAGRSAADRHLGRGAGAQRGHPLADTRFAVVDVETNGGVAGAGGRMVEIAIVEVHQGELGRCYSTLLDAGIAIPPWITRLTGIRTEMTYGAPRFEQIGDEVRSRLAGRVFVAHNVAFDWGFVRTEFQRIGAALPRGPRLCTIHMARRLLPGLERRGLDSVANYYGVEISHRHRARGDAVATARILIRLLAEAERRGWTTWPQLRRGLGPLPRRKRDAQSSRGVERGLAADAGWSKEPGRSADAGWSKEPGRSADTDRALGQSRTVGPRRKAEQRSTDSGMTE